MPPSPAAMAFRMQRRRGSTSGSQAPSRAPPIRWLVQMQMRMPMPIQGRLRAACRGAGVRRAARAGVRDQKRQRKQRRNRPRPKRHGVAPAWTCCSACLSAGGGLIGAHDGGAVCAALEFSNPAAVLPTQFGSGT